MYKYSKFSRIVILRGIISCLITLGAKWRALSMLKHKPRP